MKYLSLFTALMFLQLTTAQFTFTQEEKDRINPLLEKGVKINNDEHEGISWIKSKEVDIDIEKDITMSIYFGVTKENGKIIIMPMHIVNDLRLSRWLFFDEVSILVGSRKDRASGNTQRYLYEVDDPQRDARGSGVRERSDDIATPELMEFIRLMVNEPKAFHIRYSNGETYHEEFYGIFFKKFRKSFGPVLKSYDSLKNEFGN